MAIAPSAHAQLLLSSLALFLLLFIPSRSSALRFRTSAISSAPSALPRLPMNAALSPTLAPDVMPLFPSPGSRSGGGGGGGGEGGGGAAPASSLPIIPSSPSPPNPDALPQPDSDIAPIGAAASSAAAPAAGRAAAAAAVASAVVAAWWCLGNHGR